MSIKTNYDRWKSDYLPKLKAKLSEGDDAENSYRTNAIGIQVNGSTVNLGLLNHLDKLITIPVFRDDNKSQPATDEEREQALDSVFKMVADIVNAQKNSDSTVPVSIDISASGFSISKHPEFFRSKGLAPFKHPNVHYLENFTVSKIPDGLNLPQCDYKVGAFINFKQRLESALGSIPQTKVTYNDESGEQAITNCAPDSPVFQINMTTMNDTNTLAFQLGDQLNEGDTVIGVVGGTGFNVGVNKNFNKSAGSFQQISNLECGASVLPESDLNDFLSPIDKVKLQAEPNTPPEWFFAGGQEDQGLVNIAKTLREIFNEYNEQSLQDSDGRSGFELFSEAHAFYIEHSNDTLVELTKANQVSEFLISLKSGKKISDFPDWLTGSESLTNQLIMNKAQENDPLALAMVTDFAKRWGGFIKNRLDSKRLLNGVDNPKCATTGSHLQHLLRIPLAKKAFAEALGVPEGNLINIEKGEMDGMQAILKAKIALAKASAPA